MEEVRNQVLEKLQTITEGTSEWKSAVALCGGETDREKQADHNCNSYMGERGA